MPQPTKEAVFEALKTVKDPEIPTIDIVNLGLVYDVNVGANGVVAISMTLTSMACPAGAAFEEMVREAAASVAGVTRVVIAIVWDPPWTPQRASADGKIMLAALGVRVE